MTPEVRDKRMDGYIRVSRRLGREGESYISPKVQREAIERWAEYKGVTIAQWHIDEDWSGGTQERPGLEAAIDRAIRGETDGVVSWKIDRFSRYTEGGLRDLARLDEANARLAFVVEDVDTGGPMGKFVYTVMLAMAEYFLENIKAGWVASKTAAIKRGVHIGPTPLGYVRNEDSTLAMDPDAGPVVARAFKMAATMGVIPAMDYLREAAPQRTWTTFTTHRFLSNRVYLGEITQGEGLGNKHAHVPLVPRNTFEAVQQRISERPKGVRRPNGQFPLSQIATCGTCGSYMVGARGGGDRRRMYRCSARCERPAVVSADLLEGHVVGIVRDAFDHPGFQVGSTSAELREAEQALEQAETDLDLFAADTRARDILGPRYYTALEQMIATMDEAREKLRTVLATSPETRVVLPAELWDSLEPAELAEVLRAGLQAVVVRRGRLPIDQRTTVIPKGLDSSLVPGSEDA